MTRTLLLTRPKADAERLAAAFGEGVDVIVAPVLKIAYLDGEIARGDEQAVMLTSRHAVPSARRLAPDVPCYCVGDATAAAAREAGLKAVSASGAMPDLVGILLRDGVKSVLYLQGRHTRPDTAQRLASADIQARSVVVYDQVERAWKPKEIEKIAKAEAIVLPVFSPRSAALIAPRLDNFSGDLTIVAISDAAAQAWDGSAKAKIVIADRPDAQSMRQAMESQLA